MEVVLLSAISSTVVANELPRGKIGCFADVGKKSDRKTDVVTFAGTEIKVMKQTKVKPGIKHFKEHATINTSKDVKSVSAFDLDKNGIADLFVVTESDPVGGPTFEMNVWLDSEDGDGFVKHNGTGINRILLADEHALVLDGNSDFVPDVFGQRRKTDGDAEYGFWKGPDFEFTPVAGQPTHVDGIAMRSASFIDLDQDCKADLVYIDGDEVKMTSGDNWITKGLDLTKAKTVVNLATLEVPAQRRLFFADINKDGAMDIIIPSSGKKLYLFIQTENVHFKNLCTSKKTLSESSFKRITLTIDYGEYEFTADDLPIIVQDIDMSSELNFVAVLQKPAPSNQRTIAVFTISGKKDDDTVSNMRWIASKLDQFAENVEDIAFFHSGSFPLGLHLMVQGTDGVIRWHDLGPALVAQNNGFLSVRTLNDKEIKFNRYGGTMPGAHIVAFFRARSGREVFLTSGTLFQSHSGLHLLPFVVLGLGPPDSYIEKLVIAYSLHHGKSYALRQPGVPPNSQLVLFASPRDDTSKWRLETFLAPYITAGTLAIIITVVLGLLSMVWVYLEVKERKSEKHEKAKAGSTTNNNFFF